MRLIYELGAVSPALMKSSIILLVFVIAGWVVKFLFEKIFRQLAKETKTEIDDELVELLNHPVFWSVLLAGFYIATLPLLLPPAFLLFLQRTVITISLSIWGITGIRISRVLFAGLAEKLEAGGDEMLDDFLPFLDNVVKTIVIVVVLLTALSVWGIDITPALASAGVVGVAVAFAAKDTVANLFGGISVFFDRPYKTGDYVIVNDKYRGEVMQIGMRSTKIKTRDNVLLTVPNSVMVTNAVVNETGFDPKLRVRIPLGVAYGTNLGSAERVLIETAKGHSKVLERPAPRVRFRRFGESGIELELLCVIAKPQERGQVIHELIKQIYNHFKKEGIKIPYPQRDIHVIKEEV